MSIGYILQRRSSDLLHRYILLASLIKPSLACQSPCSTCTSASLCTSCVSNYYFTSSASSCTACPSGKASNGGTVSLCSDITCTSPCATCTSATACTNCVANYYYSSSYSSCTACSPGYYSYGGSATSCTRMTYLYDPLSRS